jgi:hypothetical protein
MDTVGQQERQWGIVSITGMQFTLEIAVLRRRE